MNSPEQLFESISPNGNVIARVEQDETTCYFYLQGEAESPFEGKACWVRNLQPAPKTLDVAAMREGFPPLLPRQYCAHPLGAPPLLASNLSVIWSEEGDAAALLENDTIIAVIPSWSGFNGFHGYARDCISESPLCWALGTPSTNAQFAHFERAARYWALWDDGDGPWPEFQTQMCRAIEQRLGAHSNYYAIDGQKWPPKALLRIPSDNEIRLVTVGMALRAQPGVESHFDDPSLYRRVELGVSLAGSLPDSAIKQVGAYISAQTNLPWEMFTFLGEGHTIPSDVFADLSNGAFPFALLLAAPSRAPELNLPRFHDDPVTPLWLTPISASEQRFSEENGSKLLAQKLRAQSADWCHGFRRQEVA